MQLHSLANVDIVAARKWETLLFILSLSFPPLSQCDCLPSSLSRALLQLSSRGLLPLGLALSSSHESCHLHLPADLLPAAATQGPAGIPVQLAPSSCEAPLAS